jgi:type 1 glutamine amidotransferase
MRHWSRQLLACFAVAMATGSGGTLSRAAEAAGEPIKVLIVDGQNNHQCWPKTTQMMKRYLEETKRFTVDVVTHAPKGPDPSFKPTFSDYGVVVSNFGHGASEWPKETEAAFEAYVSNGGGFVVVHAADNSFPAWEAYNKMIGLGGWGGRNEKSGPYVYFDEAGKLVRDPSPGKGGSHGPQHEFPIVVRDADHPVTKGMPASWMHAKDELYDSLRGPAENMNVLATAWSPVTKRHEPMIMTIDYGKGRVFHTPMGHETYSMECVGFLATLQRGCEWAATGTVTIPLPDDFPGEKVSSRTFAW